MDPPAGAPVGERVTWEGLDGYEPVTPAQVEKKKVVVKAMPVRHCSLRQPVAIVVACHDGSLPLHARPLCDSQDFKTDADRVAGWQGHRCMTSAGPVVAPTLADANIS